MEMNFQILGFPGTLGAGLLFLVLTYLFLLKPNRRFEPPSLLLGLLCGVKSMSTGTTLYKQRDHLYNKTHLPKWVRALLQKTQKMGGFENSQMSTNCMSRAFTSETI